VCGHHNSEGQIIGGVVYGVWIGHRYELTEDEQAIILNRG
jgi:hypothetical protein